jgi:hypothetical protein
VAKSLIEEAGYVVTDDLGVNYSIGLNQAKIY